MLPTVARSLLRDDVYLRLREAIVDGRLQPGQQLRDTDLAEDLGVSRTPVREALLKLADSGLVSASPGRSTVVAPLDATDVRDARDVVAAMHEVAVRTAAATLTTADLAAMAAANDRFAAAIRESDIEAALAADDDLHAIPVRVAANRAVSSVLDQFTPVVRRAERLRFSSVDGLDSIHRHQRLIAHLADGDTEAAARVAFDTWHSLSANPAVGPARSDPAPATLPNYLDRRG